MSLRFKDIAIFILITMVFGVQSIAAATKVKLTNVSVSPNTVIESAKIKFTLNTTAKITLKIYDSKNVQSKTLAISKSYKRGAHFISWNLLDSKGKRVLPGKYRFNLSAKTSVNVVTKNLTVQVIADNKVKFEEMKYLSSSNVSVWKNAKDSNKKTYPSGLLFDLTGSREIDLQKKYKQFKGTIVVPYEDVAPRNTSSIMVYIDDVLTLTTTPQNKGTEAYQIDIDLTNASKIKFVISSNQVGDSVIPPRLGFVNTYFYKLLT